MLRIRLQLMAMGALTLAGCVNEPISETVAARAPAEIHVAKTGNDANSGEHDAPLLTISEAASRAMPGDTVIVAEGVYREWVSPARGGTGPQRRITYRAADGADVIIAGSERVDGWVKEGGVWRLDLSAAEFGEFNPFDTGIRHPQYVAADEAGDGWGWLKIGRWAHLGDVYLKGEGLTERETIARLDAPMSWYTETRNGITTIWANFGDADPNQSGVEINHRPYGFFPEAPGLDYITVQGFVITNIAAHWAPPSVFQPGAVGPNGGNHWIIENNAILYSKGACISIGVPSDDKGASEGGGHIVQNNVLLRCGHAGILGQSWNQDTLISGNRIEETAYREEYGGWETAGIKAHVADNLVIADNQIIGVSTADPEEGAAHGIWIDFRNTNVRLERNIIAGAESDSILIEANWDGPTVMTHNIVEGGRLASASTRRETWNQNVFLNTEGRWESQDWGGRIPISDAEWTENVFIGGEGLAGMPEDAPNYFADRNIYAGGAVPGPLDTNVVLNEVLDSAQLSFSPSVVLRIDFSEGEPDLPDVLRSILEAHGAQEMSAPGLFSLVAPLPHYARARRLIAEGVPARE